MDAYNRYIEKNPKAQKAFNALAAQAHESGEAVGARKILEAMRKQLNVGCDNGLASDFARTAMKQDDRLDGYFHLKEGGGVATAESPEPDQLDGAIAPGDPVDVASLPTEGAKPRKTTAADDGKALGAKLAKRVAEAAPEAKGSKGGKLEQGDMTGAMVDGLKELNKKTKAAKPAEVEPDPAAPAKLSKAEAIAQGKAEKAEAARQAKIDKASAADEAKARKAADAEKAKADAELAKGGKAEAAEKAKVAKAGAAAKAKADKEAAAVQAKADRADAAATAKANKPAKAPKATDGENRERQSTKVVCGNCGHPKVVARERCNACYTCLKRKGHERDLTLEEKRLARVAVEAAEALGEKTPA